MLYLKALAAVLRGHQRPGRVMDGDQLRVIVDLLRLRFWGKGGGIGTSSEDPHTHTHTHTQQQQQQPLVVVHCVPSAFARALGGVAAAQGALERGSTLKPFVMLSCLSAPGRANLTGLEAPSLFRASSKMCL